MRLEITFNRTEDKTFGKIDFRRFCKNSCGIIYFFDLTNPFVKFT